MSRKKEFKPSDSYHIESLGGQAEPEDTAPDQPWRYALMVRTYQYWRYVGTDTWKFDQKQWPARRVVAEFTPGELTSLLSDGLRELAIAPRTFNDNLAAAALEGN